MKKIGKILLVSLLLLVAVVGIFGEPSEDLAVVEYLLTLLTTKLVGIGCAIAAYHISGKYFQKVINAADHD